MHNIPLPLTMVRLLRLNLFIRIACGPNCKSKVLAYAAREGQKSWLRIVMKDFDWIKNVDASAETSSFSSFKVLDEWVPAVVAQPLKWKRIVKDICSRPAANFATGLSPDPMPVSVDSVFECDTCEYVCSSFQQLRLHEFRVHGRTRISRRFVGPLNSCPSCLRRYPTRTQALHHVSCSTKCHGFHEWAEEFDTAIIDRLESDENARVIALKLEGGTDTCQLRSLPNIAGPLRREYAHCFKGRRRTFNG